MNHLTRKRFIQSIPGKFDILVIGGGMVGASLACALEGSRFRVGLVESASFSDSIPASYNDRAIALSLGSVNILRNLDQWATLAREVQPIDHIHVSERGGFGQVHMDADDLAVEALGYVVPAPALGQRFAERLRQLSNTEVIEQARMTSIRMHPAYASVTIEQNGEQQTLHAGLVVAADGVSSSVRQQLGIGVDRRDYQQFAVVTNVTAARPHNNTAYERFTSQGPLALLPLTGGRSGLVWTVDADDVKRVLALDEASFLKELQHRFGWRMGRFQRAGERSAFPLSLVRSREQIRQRVVVLGNAAHALHPIGGQGFNLGLRDVQALADLLLSTTQTTDVGEITLLERYARGRQADQQQITGFTHGLAKLFIASSPWLRFGRNWGMLMMELMPVTKDWLAKRAMGLSP